MTTGTGRIPELCAGDRLTRDEFERRHEAMPQVKKAELIEGVVYMPSPVSHTRHGVPHALVSMWLSLYATDTPGTEVGDNSTVRLDLDNEPQPDLLLRVSKGGNTVLSREGYVEGAPELVVEVAASRVSYDLHVKLNAYRRNGVREYMVWRVAEEAVDWFILRGDEYAKLQDDPHRVLRSECFPGPWLHVPALLGHDGATLRATLQQGLADPSHAAFRVRMGGSTG